MTNHQSTKESALFIPLVVITILFFLTNCVTWIVISEFWVFNLALTAFTLVLATIALYLKRHLLERWARTSYFKTAASYLLSAFLLFSILALLNYIGFKRNVQWDFSLDRESSLSQYSQGVVKQLTKGPIVVQAFYRRQDANLILPLIDLYRLYNRQIEVELIDPDLRPDLVEQYQVKEYQTVIFSYQGRQERTRERTEAAFTRTLVTLLNERAPVVRFLTGHGESRPEDSTELGLSHLKKLLEAEHYQVVTEDLQSDLNLDPTLTDLLVIWDPKTPLFTGQIQRIEKYLQAGGRLMLALSPNLNGFLHGELTKMVANYGVKMSNLFVVDRGSYVNGSNAMVPLVKSYSSEHPIVATLGESTFFPFCLAMQIGPGTQGPSWDIEVLAETSPYPQSWAESDVNQILEMNFTFGQGDISGPMPLVVAIRPPQSEQGEVFKEFNPHTRLMLFANPTFVQNRYQQFSANFNLLLNSVNWLVETPQPNFMGDRPLAQRAPVFISSLQQGLIIYFCLMVAPMALIACAIYFYRRKQRL